ncbi:uncharacterized protein LOC143295053 isoform X2 [Babylonia areolata]|uniref:uncharacterized protein LOC143295053 isoform X2 n=1 Tax=Babylonia areolata TaxID=304850 RepID=UPI003FCFAF50
MLSVLHKALRQTDQEPVMWLLWMSSLTMVLMTKGTMAQNRNGNRNRKRDQYPSPPPPPSTKQNPTWRTALGGSTTVPSAEEAVDPLTGWPWWWWWIAAGVGAVFVIVLIVVVCVCCCRRRRKRRPTTTTTTTTQGSPNDEGEVRLPPTDFRRMESTAAKRYLHNIVSVWSWGSDFEASDQGSRNQRPPTTVIYGNLAQGYNNSSNSGNSNVVYANPQTLQVPPTSTTNTSITMGGSSSSSDARKSGQHYRNLL